MQDKKRGRQICRPLKPERIELTNQSNHLSFVWVLSFLPLILPVDLECILLHLSHQEKLWNQKLRLLCKNTWFPPVVCQLACKHFYTYNILDCWHLRIQSSAFFLCHPKMPAYNTVKPTWIIGYDWLVPKSVRSPGYRLDETWSVGYISIGSDWLPLLDLNIMYLSDTSKYTWYLQVLKSVGRWNSVNCEYRNLNSIVSFINYSLREELELRAVLWYWPKEIVMIQIQISVNRSRVSVWNQLWWDWCRTCS